MSVELLIKKQNVILDATVMTALMGCERFFDFRFNQNLMLAGGHGNPLQAGTMVHKITEAFNLAIIDGKVRNTAVMIGLEAGQKFYKTPEAENIPDENVLDKQGKIKEVGYNWIMETMQQYFKFWQNDNWTAIEAERVRGEVVYEDNETRVLWKAKLDKIVDTFQDGIMPGDYKTMKQQRNPLKLNNQFMGQCLVAKTRKMFIDKIGFQRSLPPEEKFVRQVMSYSSEQLAEQVETIGYYAKYLVALQQQGYYPPRYTHCDKYNGCVFRMVCESNPSDRDRILKQNFMVGEPWNPSNDDDVD